ncbi:tRNA modification GTPase MnmE [Vitis vinifera]|uniref:tRNA modification GTPase MnmE n=1 Tax=Vitis vinifera TaxID=29760 RepID=A0A438F863_VITVI|nr:tRNA modification GTPase MnmE [Vitis vinifera]
MGNGQNVLVLLVLSVLFSLWNFSLMLLIDQVSRGQNASDYRVSLNYEIKLVLAIPMLAPRSYTREDVVELQCHGSEVCLRRVLRACLESGARLAEPG